MVSGRTGQGAGCLTDISCPVKGILVDVEEGAEVIFKVTGRRTRACLASEVNIINGNTALTDSINDTFKHNLHRKILNLLRITLDEFQQYLTINSLSLHWKYLTSMSI